MKKLILHIGTGKTGSTSIQKTFIDIKNSEYYFNFNMKGYSAIRDIDNWTKTINKKDHNKIIYSNEWLYQAPPEFIKEFSLKTKNKFEVQILIYLRRQDQFLVSAYQQIGKSGNGSSEYGPISLPMDYDMARIDYESIVNKWANYFGASNIKIRVFSKESLFGGDVISDFANAIDETIDMKQTKKANSSEGIVKTKLGHLINYLGMNDKRSEILKDIPESRKALPSRVDAINFYGNFIESNIRLNKRFCITDSYEDIFNKDFSMYPETRNDLWCEETANIAITHILNKFKNRKGTVDTLIDLAVNLEKKDIKTSYDLMCIAKRLRPNGPFINHKLSTYKEQLYSDKKEDK